MRRTCSSSGAGVPSGRGLLGCGRVPRLALVVLAGALPPLTVAPLLTVATPPAVVLPVARDAGAAVFVGLLPLPPHAASSALTALAVAIRSIVRRCTTICSCSDESCERDVVLIVICCLPAHAQSRRRMDTSGILVVRNLRLLRATGSDARQH